ncbi:hypothetical protein AJ80_01523 [Polytolypa hystricis UAMH7299]|uniref:Uncharacterized protein n=1 Tax=Polytolypa hystricis (strain UAMH7299) TaxID=1447883 RepID=A0A2B7Z0J5_POLH7|nr:hypothetical protein AJ80_01523 [Polytolypa hystricis UAMH7299]
MFSASLRKRPLWRTVGPLLASLATLRLKGPSKESSIRTHDFEIPYVQGTRSSSLLTLLFTPASLQTAARTDTIARIDRFYALTGGRDIVIALLLSENEEEANRPGAQVDMRPLLELQVLDTRTKPARTPTHQHPNNHRLKPNNPALIAGIIYKSHK